MQRNESIRESLKAMCNEDSRYKFEATFEKLGKDKRFKYLGKVLLTHIFYIKELDNGSIEKIEITDHTWIAQSKRWNTAIKTLKKGDKVEFTSEIKSYEKEGKKNFFTDYGLSSIRNVKIITKG